MYTGPSYVAAQSAEVILSDVRPIRLKVEALKAINVLLDEFLFNILKSANSLSTDRLRASLLGLLPTSLGKEALLEAEVELRAYYERMGTGAVSALGDDTKTFNFQFAFKLLRLKCAAYSTLNDSDEDPNTEACIMEKMRDAGVVPFTAVRIAPAALYLTAIVEHILSNVAKVTARDSSRTDATIQDLYTALCEDESIYGMFKSMKVYEQVGQLSSKPFARSEKQSISRSHHDSTATAATVMSGSNSSRTRVSSDTQSGSISGSRSSFDTSRVMKKLISNRSSHEREDSQGTYTQQDSASQSSSLRRSTSTQEENEKNPSFETLQGFDDLMRSTSTMKVSLTPDRLKTMEAYKQEKDQRAQKMLVNNKLDADTSSVVSGSGRLSARQVESIVEDEEEGNAFPKLPPASRHRQGSITSPPDEPSLASNRNRSFSMSSSSSRAFGKKLLRNTPPVSSSHMFHSPSLSSMRAPNQAVSRQLPGGADINPFPVRTRKVQRHRESLDLDDVMNGLDDDIPSSAKQTKPPVATHTIHSEPAKKGVSQSTRDLMDFLSEGPPETPSMGSSFDGPSASPKMSATDTARKTPGRLQRMISKLSIGGSDRPDGRDGLRTPTKPTPPPVPYLPTKPPSIASLPPLANKPIPPRYPRPPSPPPSSPSQSSTDEPIGTRAKKSSAAEQEGKSINVNHHGHKSSDRAYPITPASSSRVSPAHDPVSLPPQTLTRSPSFRKPVPPITPLVSPPTETVPPAVRPTPSGPLSGSDAHEIHRLMSHAGSADECRLILDMFLARAGIRVEGAKPVTVTLPPGGLSLNDSPLESTVVELFLGGESLQEIPSSPRRLRFKRHRKGFELRPHTADGALISLPPDPSVANTPLL
ncbi:hypothetical protein F5887DRAFT_884708 [Amanita rubescens]|nr:hypothetical protein F5887DRAFT_884708 [Amanita rubescens]